MAAIPKYQELMQPVLESAQDGEVRIRDVVEQLADQFNLSKKQRQERIPSGNRTRFADRVSWAKTYLKQAGLVKVPRRGYFLITERGRKALKDGVEINNAYLERFEEFKKFQAPTRTTVASPIQD